MVEIAWLAGSRGTSVTMPFPSWDLGGAEGGTERVAYQQTLDSSKARSMHSIPLSAKEFCYI